ncbi:hypothetical protein HK098_002122 [Nowakowskiella sp. JEL0407]|nr:hypothetical protein HK098_002122 [Nowakowskiella sp. JEL0407]
MAIVISNFSGTGKLAVNIQHPKTDPFVYLFYLLDHFNSSLSNSPYIDTYVVHKNPITLLSWSNSSQILASVDSTGLLGIWKKKNNTQTGWKHTHFISSEQKSTIKCLEWFGGELHQPSSGNKRVLVGSTNIYTEGLIAVSGAGSVSCYLFDFCGEISKCIVALENMNNINHAAISFIDVNRGFLVVYSQTIPNVLNIYDLQLSFPIYQEQTIEPRISVTPLKQINLPPLHLNPLRSSFQLKINSSILAVYSNSETGSQMSTLSLPDFKPIEMKAFTIPIRDVEIIAEKSEILVCFENGNVELYDVYLKLLKDVSASKVEGGTFIGGLAVSEGYGNLLYWDERDAVLKMGRLSFEGGINDNGVECEIANEIVDCLTNGGDYQHVFERYPESIDSESVQRILSWVENILMSKFMQKVDYKSGWFKTLQFAMLDLCRSKLFEVIPLSDVKDLIDILQSFFSDPDCVFGLCQDSPWKKSIQVLDPNVFDQPKRILKLINHTKRLLKWFEKLTLQLYFMVNHNTETNLTTPTLLQYFFNSPESIPLRSNILISLKLWLTLDHSLSISMPSHPSASLLYQALSDTQSQTFINLNAMCALMQVLAGKTINEKELSVLVESQFSGLFKSGGERLVVGGGEEDGDVDMGRLETKFAVVTSGSVPDWVDSIAEFF